MMGGAAGFFVSTLRFDVELTGPRGLTRLAMESPPCIVHTQQNSYYYPVRAKRAKGVE